MIGDCYYFVGRVIGGDVTSRYGNRASLRAPGCRSFVIQGGLALCWWHSCHDRYPGWYPWRMRCFSCHHRYPGCKHWGLCCLCCCTSIRYLSLKVRAFREVCTGVRDLACYRVKRDLHCHVITQIPNTAINGATVHKPVWIITQDVTVKLAILPNGAVFDHLYIPANVGVVHNSGDCEARIICLRTFHFGCYAFACWTDQSLTRKAPGGKSYVKKWIKICTCFRNKTVHKPWIRLHDCSHSLSADSNSDNSTPRRFELISELSPGSNLPW